MDARYFRLIDRTEDHDATLDPDLSTQFDSSELFAEFCKVFNHPDTTSYINKMTHFDQKTLLPALLQVEDRVSMSVSLEARVPLLDTRIVDLVTTMPPPLKFNGGKMKHVLKTAIQTLLPREILERKDKMGFPVPIEHWMKQGPVRDFVGDVLLSRKSIERGVYRESALRGMMTEQGVGGRQLWGALSLELWHREFIDG
jgi:asparagine synthase (glutamine-hydrolysing)